MRIRMPNTDLWLTTENVFHGSKWALSMYAFKVTSSIFFFKKCAVLPCPGSDSELFGGFSAFPSHPKNSDYQINVHY